MMLKKWVAMLVAVAMVSAMCQAASPGYIRFTGKSQGPIQGGVTRVGYEGTCEVQAYTHSVSAVPMIETCFPDKSDRHTVFSIIKPIDSASVPLLNAFQNREPLSAEMKLYEVTPHGTNHNYYTIKLTNAIVTAIRQEIPHVDISQYQNMVHMERISLVYENIAFIHTSQLGEVQTAKLTWEANCSEPPTSDVNFDGRVDLKDFAILADEWLTGSY